MPTQVQVRRGTTAEHSSFTGAVGELTVDTDKDVVVVHDGSTAGGRPMLRQDQSNLPTSAPSNGVYIPSSNNVAISTNGTGRLFVDASGNVGVGTSLPSDALTVSRDSCFAIAGTGFTTFSGTDFYHAKLTLQDPSSRTVILRSPDTIGEGAIGTSTNHPFTFITNNTERMRLDSSGRLGLGSSSPSHKLTVSNTDGSNAGITLLGNDQANARIRIDNGGSGGRNWELTAGLTGANNSYFSIYDQTASASRFVISDTGAVGIGVTGPSNTIDVNGTGRFRLGGTNQLVFTTDGGNPYILSEQNAPLHFGTNNLLRATIDSSGRLLVGTTTATANGGVLELSGGITFPATQVAASNANTLDDYEEGTFTYEIKAGGSNYKSGGGGFTGYYIKIGNTVTLQGGALQVITVSAATGDLTITGLPFTSSEQVAVVLSALQEVSFADYPSARINPNTATIDLFETTNAGTRTTLTNSNWPNNGFLTWLTTYRVA